MIDEDLDYIVINEITGKELLKLLSYQYVSYNKYPEIIKLLRLLREKYGD
jgi:hypothetical protein